MLFVLVVYIFYFFVTMPRNTNLEAYFFITFLAYDFSFSFVRCSFSQWSTCSCARKLFWFFTFIKYYNKMVKVLAMLLNVIYFLISMERFNILKKESLGKCLEKQTFCFLIFLASSLCKTNIIGILDSKTSNTLVSLVHVIVKLNFRK